MHVYFLGIKIAQHGQNVYVARDWKALITFIRDSRGLMNPSGSLSIIRKSPMMPLVNTGFSEKGLCLHVTLGL